MNATSPTKLAIFLEPLDVLFFRDGRPFGATSRVKSGQPLPQTFFGAVCTALLEKYGCDFAQLSTYVRQAGSADLASAFEASGAPRWIAHIQTRGPWLARKPSDNASPIVYIPMPAIIHASKSSRQQNRKLYHRLAPLNPNTKLPGWHDRQGLHPLWLRSLEPTEPAEGYLSLDGLRTLLINQMPKADDIVSSHQLFGYDMRTGIEINQQRLVSEEGKIYGIELLMLAPGVGYYGEVILPPDAPRNAFEGIRTLSFGGEARRVGCQLVPSVSWPNVQPRHDQEKPLIILTTPGLFTAGWKPKWLESWIHAAAVPAFLAASGWDLARGGPKPTRFAAASGSVYFLNSLPNNLPDTLADEPLDRNQGWGCYVQGVWSYE